MPNTVYKILVSAHAKADVDETGAYLAVNLDNKKAARDFLVKLRKKYETISDNPQLHPLSRNPVLRHKGYRWCPVGNYLVFYTIDEAHKEIHLARVLYGRRNLESLL